MPIFLYLLFTILTFFVPLSFASTEPWAFFILQISLVFILFYLLFKKTDFAFSFPSKIVASIFVFLITLSFIQLLNPRTIVQKSSVFPFTICPFYTLNEANNLFTYFMLFFIITQLFESSKKLEKLILILFMSSSVIMIIGLCFPKGEYIKFFLGTGFSGSFGSFVNRNSAGLFLSMSFFIALSFTLANSLDYKKYLQQNKKTEFIFRQTIRILFCASLFASVVLSRSRGAMLATFISLFIFSVLTGYYLPNALKTRIKYIAAACILFALSSFLIYKNLDAINAYSHRTSGGFSEQTRRMLYVSAFDMLKDYPMTGVGVAAFPVSINKYFDKSLDAYTEHLHNDWLELLLGIGYIAGAAFFLTVFILVYAWFSRIRYLNYRKKIYFICFLSVILSLSIGSLFDFHFHIPANSFIFFIVLGLLCSSSFYKEKIKYAGIPVYLKTFIVFISLYFLYFSANNALAWRYFIFGENLMPKSQISYYEKGVGFSDNPRYLEKLIIAYYNMYFYKNSSETDAAVYYKKTNDFSRSFLKKYPFNKKISYIYQMTL